MIFGAPKVFFPPESLAIFLCDGETLAIAMRFAFVLGEHLQQESTTIEIAIFGALRFRQFLWGKGFSTFSAALAGLYSFGSREIGPAVTVPVPFSEIRFLQILVSNHHPAVLGFWLVAGLS